ncbi:MAG: ABC transporter ATP-binding protein [Candidatus Pacebacteria bacterium]|nr:ABC transporter ATP-binding protein [Candidatus Paceibacterota bacterium]
MVDIRLQNIVKTFGAGPHAVRAVDSVNLTIKGGELFFLLGPSGCGKTTLLRAVAGLAPPDEGQVWFGDRDVTHEAVEDRGAAMVFQNYALWPHMTVRRNIEYGPRMQGKKREERARLADDKLELVRMAAYGGRKPPQLSGGQQQRVALARALAAQPACLLLDEPLSNLDAQLRLRMREELRRLVKSTGTTGLYVTHDQKEALSMGDRIAVMHEGRVVQVGTPEELYERPQSKFVAGFVGEANFFEGRVTQLDDQTCVESEDGRLPVDASRLPSGVGQVEYCIRPEKLRLQVLAESEVLPAGCSGFMGAVVERSYLGDVCQYVCRLASGACWKVTVLGSRDIAGTGEKICLTARAEDVIPLLKGPGEE